MGVRNPLLVVIAMLGLFAGFTACSRDDDSASPPAGDDDGGSRSHGDLTTGEYRISEPIVIYDGCSVMAGMEGETDDVTVDGHALGYNLATGNIDGGDFEATALRPLDLTADPFGAGAIDCLLNRGFRYAGSTSLAGDAANVDYTFTLDAGIGSECGLAADLLSGVFDVSIHVPCGSRARYHIERLPPLTGTLSLLATNGLLTLVGAQGSNSGFTLTGSLEDGDSFSEPSRQWMCWAPDPPIYPNYDLYIGGTDYVLVLSIATDDWAPGNVPIANLPDASLFSPEASAILTDGSLEILDAPGAPGSTTPCAVRLTDVPFVDLSVQQLPR